METWLYWQEIVVNKDTGSISWALFEYLTLGSILFRYESYCTMLLDDWSANLIDILSPRPHDLSLSFHVKKNPSLQFCTDCSADDMYAMDVRWMRLDQRLRTCSRRPSVLTSRSISAASHHGTLGSLLSIKSLQKSNVVRCVNVF